MRNPRRFMGLVYLYIPTFHLNLWIEVGTYSSPMEHVGIGNLSLKDNAFLVLGGSSHLVC